MIAVIENNISQNIHPAYISEFAFHFHSTRHSFGMYIIMETKSKKERLAEITGWALALSWVFIAIVQYVILHH